MWSELFDISRKKKPKPASYRVTTFFEYRLKDGGIGKGRFICELYKITENDGGKMLCYSMGRMLTHMCENNFPVVAIHVISKKEYENMVLGDD